MNQLYSREGEVISRVRERDRIRTVFDIRIKVLCVSIENALNRYINVGFSCDYID